MRSTKTLLAALYLGSLASLALAHGGGLDQYGGHKDASTGTYHYHRDSQGNELDEPQTAADPNAGGPKGYSGAAGKRLTKAESEAKKAKAEAAKKEEAKAKKKAKKEKAAPAEKKEKAEPKEVKAPKAKKEKAEPKAEKAEKPAKKTKKAKKEKAK